MEHLRPQERVELLLKMPRPQRRRLVHLLACPRCREDWIRVIEGREAISPENPIAGSKALDLILDRAEEVGRGLEARLAEDRDLVAGLWTELMARPPSRWGDAAADDRFASPGLVERLLAAGSAPEEGGRAERMAALALDLSSRLEARRWPPSLALPLRVRALVRAGEAHGARGDLGAAEDAFQRAAYLLDAESFDSAARATFCLGLADLRQAQARNDEALGLLVRAAALFRDRQDFEQLGLARAREGELYLQEESPATALPPLLEAMTLLAAERFPWQTTQVHLQVALCLAELGRGDAAARSLAAALKSSQSLSSAKDRFRFLWLEARVLERIGKRAEAVSRLLAAAKGLACEAPGDAPLAALELVRLWLDLGRKPQLPTLASALVPLLQTEAIPRRSRSVLEFVLRFAARHDVPVPELVERALQYLRRARRNPHAEFPPRQEPLRVAAWDGLAPDFKLDLCRLTGLDDEAAKKPAADLDATTREHLSWAAEELLQTAILYGPPVPG